MRTRHRPVPRRSDEMLLEQIDALQIASGGREERKRKTLEGLEQRRVDALSDGGLVRVVVDADGAVVRTQVAAEALGHPLEALEAAFTEAAREAADAARSRRGELLNHLAAETAVVHTEVVTERSAG